MSYALPTIDIYERHAEVAAFYTLPAPGGDIIA